MKLLIMRLYVYTGLTIERLEFESRQAQKMFCSPLCPDRFWGSPKPPITGVPGAPSPGLKRPVREADLSSESIAEIKET
jgi:hypothetical protein